MTMTRAMRMMMLGTNHQFEMLIVQKPSRI